MKNKKFNFFNDSKKSLNIQGDINNILGNAQYLPATGMPLANQQVVAQPAPIQESIDSEPYVIRLENTGTDAKSDVTILDAATNFRNSANNYGLDSDITMTYSVPGRTIEQFLGELLTADSYIGQIYMESNVQSNLTAPCTVETYSIQGGGKTSTLDYSTDPYQTQTGVAVFTKRFVWNKFTKYTIGSLAASSVFTIKFYPIATNLQARGKEYARPVIARPADRNLGM